MSDQRELLAVIMSAILDNDEDAVRQALQKGLNPDFAESDGFTCLHRACADGRASIVSLLIEQGADVNKADKANYSPLHYAAQAQSPTTVKLLLSAGAEPNSMDKNGNTPIAIVSSRKLSDQEEVFRLLLCHGANPYIANSYGKSTIDRIMQSSESRLIEHLRDVGYL